MNSRNSTRCTLWVSRFIALAVAGLLFALPPLLDWYTGIRPLGPAARSAILIAYYVCAPAVLLALWSVERLAKNILAGLIFVTGNVSHIRRIRWCCAWVSLVCLSAAHFYAPLLFLAVIMAFLALVVSVVKNVMAAAVELREENDLTV